MRAHLSVPVGAITDNMGWLIVHGDGTLEVDDNLAGVLRIMEFGDDQIVGVEILFADGSAIRWVWDRATGVFQSVRGITDPKVVAATCPCQDCMERRANLGARIWGALRVPGVAEA